MKTTILALIMIVFVAGCTKIDYVGEEYPPTAQVDLFFTMDDVERDYKIMGHVVASADDLVSAGKMQEKIMEKARQKGADAVVILGLERYRAGETTSYTETTSTKGTKSSTTSSSDTSVKEKKEIQGTFLKYK
jgi:hypothetical protein